MHRPVLPLLARSLTALVLALALLSGGASGGLAGSAAQAGVLPPLPTSPDGDPPGANNWHCRPSATHPEPVILVHGTFGDRKHLLEGLSGAIHHAGFCVFSLDYGNRGTGDIVASAKHLRSFTHRVLRATGASKVSMVGHSQGGMMPRYFIKFLGGARLVDDLVGISPSNHGTLVKLGAPADTAPVLGPVGGQLCEACLQQNAGSAFLTRLNRGDETPGPVSYTVITTRYDEVVVPYTSAILARGPRTTNITLQNVCPLDTSDHIRIPTAVPTIAITLNALTHTGPARATYRPRCG